MIHTNVLLAKFDDYLMTVESILENQKRSGLNQIAATFGVSGRPGSSMAKRLFTAHRKRFDRDMSRFCRYSAVTGLYSMFEAQVRLFVADYVRTNPKPDFTKFCKKHSSDGFIQTFHIWLESAPSAATLRHPRIWKQLEDLQLIRNCITHANGEAALLKKPETTKEAVRRTRRIRFDDCGVLTMDAGFAFEVCERLHNFFRILFRSSGYGMTFPPGYLEAMQNSFAGFEDEIEKGIAAQNLKQTINLGGNL